MIKKILFLICFINIIIYAQETNEVKLSRQERAFLKASKDGKINTVRKYLNDNINIEVRDEEGNTALILATEWEHFDIVKLLVENNANVNARDNDLQTPLMISSILGNYEISEYLIGYGADVNMNDTTASVLFYAAGSGNYKIVELLIRNNATVKGQYGDEALIKSIFYKHNKISKLLIDNGASINAKSIDNFTALMTAIYVENIEMINYLISKGANLKIKTDDGIDALQLAKNLKNKEIIAIIERAYLK